MSRGLVAATAFFLLSSAAPTATADPVRADDDRWSLDVTAAWTRDGDAPVWHNASTGQSLVVHRIDGSGIAAWRGRKEFFEGVERGVKRAAKDYKRSKKSVGKIGRVPTLDLWFSYAADDGARASVAMRYVFFRSYAMVLAIDTPADKARKLRRPTRALLASFAPWFGDSD